MSKDLIELITLKLPCDLAEDVCYISDKLNISRDAYITAVIWDHLLSINNLYHKQQRKKNETVKKTKI